MIQGTGPTPADYGGFELSPNPAYGTVEFEFVKGNMSHAGEVQPTNDNEGGNVYVSTDGEPPAYGNLKLRY